VVAAMAAAMIALKVVLEVTGGLLLGIGYSGKPFRACPRSYADTPHLDA
jgi:hypothetical protein